MIIMIKRQIILSILLALPLLADAQTDTLRLTLSEAIALAQEQSSEAKVARPRCLCDACPCK